MGTYEFRCRDCDCVFQVPSLEEVDVQDVLCPEEGCFSSDLDLVRYDRDENILVLMAKKIGELEQRIEMIERSTLRYVRPPS